MRPQHPLSWDIHRSGQSHFIVTYAFDWRFAPCLMSLLPCSNAHVYMSFTDNTNSNSPWWSIWQPGMGTSVIHIRTHRRSVITDFKFQQSWSYNNLNCLDMIEEGLHCSHMWTKPSMKSSGEITCSSIFKTPINSADSFAWLYTGITFTHVIHILHILWGIQVVALLNPSRDSGMQGGSPFILMPKEPTRSKMAPRSLFGDWFSS